MSSKNETLTIRLKDGHVVYAILSPSGTVYYRRGGGGETKVPGGETHDAAVAVRRVCAHLGITQDQIKK